MLSGFLPQLIVGTVVTLKLAACAAIIGIVLGVLIALGELSRITPLRWLCTQFGIIIRGLPEILVLFLIYFGGTWILNQCLGPNTSLDSFVAGVIALALLFASYASQVIRGGLLAIPKGQIDAAHAFAFNNFQTFFYIIFPQLWRFILPGLGNLWFVLLKDTALVSLIGLAELLNTTQSAAEYTREPFTFYFTAAIIYLILTSVSQLVLNKITKYSYRYDS